MSTPHSEYRFSYRHAYPAGMRRALSSLDRIHIPRALRVLALLVVGFVLLTSLALTVVPWVQTTAGMIAAGRRKASCASAPWYAVGYCWKPCRSATNCGA